MMTRSRGKTLIAAALGFMLTVAVGASAIIATAGATPPPALVPDAKIGFGPRHSPPDPTNYPDAPFRMAP